MSHPPVFVIGMHRSGTTLLTRILSELGLFMGRHRDTNEETHLLINVNEQLLHRYGANWDQPEKFSTALEDGKIDEAYGFFLRCLTLPEICFFMGEKHFAEAGGKFQINRPWGAKDPRLSFTLPLWKKLFPGARIIHIIRHGVDVAASLRKRHQDLVHHVFTRQGKAAPSSTEYFRTGIVRHSGACGTLDHGLKLWDEYETECQKHLTFYGNNGYSLRYETLLQSPETEISGLCQFVGIKPAKPLHEIAASFKTDRVFAYRQSSELSDFAKENQNLLSKFGY